MNRILSVAIVALAVIVVGSSPSTAQQVVERYRLGNHMEDVTFVPSGPTASSVVWIDGYDVYALAGGGLNAAPARKLFDVRSLPLGLVPRGITYIESRKLFALGDIRNPRTLLLVDHRGRLQDTMMLNYGTGFAPAYAEGLAYIPSTSPVYPDHIAQLVAPVTGITEVAIVRADGVVVERIAPPPGLVVYAAAIAYQDPGRLIVQFGDFHTYDLAVRTWHPVSVPIVDGPVMGFEGLVEGMRGTIAGVGSLDGELRFYDARLAPLSRGYDRKLVLGPGLVYPSFLAWDGTRNRYLITHYPLPLGMYCRIADVDEGVSTMRDFLNLDGDRSIGAARRPAYLAGEDLIAVTLTRTPTQPDRIALYNDAGVLADTIPTGALVDSTGKPLIRPFAVRYDPAMRRFIVAFRSHGTKLFELSREGLKISEIDLAAVLGTAAFSGFTLFDASQPAGGRLMIVRSDGQILVTDLSGQVLAQFEARRLGIFAPIDIEYISTGPNAGAFAVLDRDGAELVVFRLDQP